jgi:hypothetical protein
MTRIRRTTIVALITVPLLGTAAATAIEYGLVAHHAAPAAIAHVNGIQCTGHAAPNGATPNGIEGTG